MDSGGEQASDGHRHGPWHHHPGLPMGGYATLLGAYGTLAGAGLVALRRKRAFGEDLSLRQLVLLGLATQHLSRLISRDAVTSVLRAPFTAYEGPAGEGEVNEEVVGSGLKKAVGELLNCPFCLGQWAATALVGARLAAPEVAAPAVSVLAVAQVSDYFQLLYALLRHQAG